MEVDVYLGESTKMTSTETAEAPLFDQNDFDSESSSSDDRNARKRFGGELETAGLKKRRKQSTPVKFSTPLMTRDNNGSEEEEDEEYEALEGKNSHQTKFLRPTSTTKSKNGDPEFSCQYCGRCFDDELALSQHIDCEHYVDNSGSERLQRQDVSKREFLQPTLENLAQTDADLAKQFPSPVNLSTISVKNFASMMPRCFDPADHAQISLQPQMMNQSDDWSSSVSTRLPLQEHVQGLPPFPGTLTQYLHYPGFPLADASQIPRSIGSAPPRIFNRDAYCDLCNKEFCNKYFLKTHKANKHGIYSDSSSQSTPSDTTVTSSIFTESFPMSHVKLEVQPLQSDNNPGSLFTASPIPSVPSDTCQKTFKTEDTRSNDKLHEESLDHMKGNAIQMSDTEEKLDAPQNQHVMGMIFKQDYGIEQEDSTFIPSPRHFSPLAMQQAKESGFNIDRLRRLGVINLEAFCEICCKEYCNKYFLRTHQMKRHGLFIQESDPSNMAKLLAPAEVQTSPLNLIVNESGSNSESGDRSEDEQECKPCGIRFQTLDLLLIHRQRLHESEQPKTLDNEVDSSNHKADSISEDLQKLQTMILQLNGLETNKNTSCHMCGKDFETEAALQTHVSLDHEVVIEDSSTPPQEAEKSPILNSNYCTLCERDYPNQETLRKHIAEEHQPSTPNSVTLSQNPSTAITTPKTSSSQPERKTLISMTPTSSFCEICNKELCNKYFMKTHMHRMHGIEISNGAQIGGVICNICNKELCSKYFLRVHKHNTHGIVEEGTTGPLKQDTFDASSSEDAASKSENPSDLNNRYFTHFTEVCPICNRRFRSVKWLKAHLLGDHGKLGVEKWKEYEEQYPVTRVGNRTSVTPRSSQSSPGLKVPNGQETAQQQAKPGDFPTLGTQVLSNFFGSSTDDQCVKTYRCSFCNFTTIALPFLFLHEKSHVNAQGNPISEGSPSLQCPVCSQVFSKPDLLHHHLLTNHQFPSLLTQFNSPVLGNLKLDIFADKNKDAKEKASMEAKINNRRDNTPVLGESKTGQMHKADNTVVQVTPQGAYKCSQCGFATANLNRIKKHVKKDHKSIGDATDSVIAELTRALKEVANKRKVPATYAIPQDMNSNPDKTIMQPFLIEEFEVALQGSDECSSMKRFAPALVYLPVNARVSTALTASFTLSPA